MLREVLLKSANFEQNIEDNLMESRETCRHRWEFDFFIRRLTLKVG